MNAHSTRHRARRSRFRVALCAAGVAATLGGACSTELPPSPCTPGSIERCSCKDGQDGVRGCYDEGLYGECVFCGKADLILNGAAAAVDAGAD